MGLDDEPRYSGILSSTNVPDQVDFFDRKMFELRGVTVDAKETNITDTETISTRTYVVKTCRHRELGDYVFIVIADKNGANRIVLPPRVTDAIARQRDALSTKVRKSMARENAAVRKASGYVPTHLNDPAVRKRALKARKAKAAIRRERRARKAARA